VEQVRFKSGMEERGSDGWCDVDIDTVDIDVDLLNNSVVTGANTSALSFKRRVGSGSVARCLSGSLRMDGNDDIINDKGAEHRECTAGQKPLRTSVELSNVTSTSRALSI